MAGVCFSSCNDPAVPQASASALATISLSSKPMLHHASDCNMLVSCSRQQNDCLGDADPVVAVSPVGGHSCCYLMVLSEDQVNVEGSMRDSEPLTDILESDQMIC